MDCKIYMSNLPPITAIIEKAESICPVDWAKNIVYIAVHQNCGKSVICRDGMKQIYRIIKDITLGKATSSDIDLIKDLCETIILFDSCEYSSMVADMVLTAINNYYDEWSKHILRKRCTALSCKSFYTVHIDASKCQGNGACVKICPHDAIRSGDGLISVIDNEKCDRCGACYTVCPHEAVAKAGAMKPKGPKEPIPIGSFGADGSDVEGGKRRRRRKS